MEAAKTSYESNPFKVIFKGFGDFFKYNQAMSIVILVISLFGAVFEMFRFLIQAAANTAGTATTTTTTRTNSGNKLGGSGDYQYSSPLDAYSGNGVEQTAPAAGTSEGDIIAIITIISVLATIVIVVWATIFVIQTIYRGMVAYTAVKTYQQKSVTIGEAFQHSVKKFWTLVWIQVVVFFKILGGTLLFIIPGS